MRVGVWEEGTFIGAIVFGCGASPCPGDQFGVKTIEVCELSRVALRAHALPVTRIIKVAMNFLRRGAPGIRIVVSYADPQQGHYGGIYQAGNWTYLGASRGHNVWRRRNGKIAHGRRVSPSVWAKRAGIWEKVIRQDECQKIVMAAKHKYAFALDKSLRPLLASMAKPYPEKGSAA